MSAKKLKSSANPALLRQVFTPLIDLAMFSISLECLSFNSAIIPD
jgi:hypothetical protein